METVNAPRNTMPYVKIGEVSLEHKSTSGQYFYCKSTDEVFMCKNSYYINKPPIIFPLKINSYFKLSELIAYK